jgi:DNA-binding NarL/FixJ family response regulator
MDKATEAMRIEERERIKVLIVDDHPVVRLGLRTMLESQGEIRVVGMAGSGCEAIAVIQQIQADVVLMDLRMPEMEGTEAIVALRKIQPGLRILVLTNYESDEYILRAMQAGAMGYLLKSSPQDEILHAVKRVNKQERYLSPQLASKFLEAMNREELSLRELEVMTLVARGMTNKEIGQRLFIGEKTARNHVTSCLVKLHAKDRTQAATIAIRRGLIRIDIE